MPESRENIFGKTLKKEIDKRGWGQSGFAQKMAVDEDSRRFH